MSAPHDLPGIFPADMEDWLRAALDLSPGEEMSEATLAPLFALNRAWTPRDAAGPELSPAYADDAAVMRTYTLYYMCINMPKLWFLLARCPGLLAELASLPEPPRVVELGCGPGTFLWAWLLYMRRHQPASLPVAGGMQGIDRAAAALAIGDRLAAGLTRWPDLASRIPTWSHRDWTASELPDADILIAGNALNELESIPVDRLAAWPGRAVIVIEPGTSETFHRLLPLRDAMLAAGWTSQFPCTGAGTCPMAADASNWCHFAVNRFMLPHVQRMSGKAGRQNPRHHFTGFVFWRGDAAPADSWRVLSRLRKANRSGIRHLCDGSHMVEAVLNRRERSDDNRWFLDADAGDAGRLDAPTGAAPLHRRKRFTSRDGFRPLDP